MNRRRLLTAAGIALAAVLLAGKIQYLLDNPAIWPPDDFVEYWAAARLALDGHNPYDPSLLLPLQQAAGRDTDEAVMMWNPPWSFAVVMPLGLMPAREAQLLWLFVNLAAVCFCGDRLWLLLGGDRAKRWAGWAIALAFIPTLFALQSGQISILPLFGAVLFLECERRGWPFLAGAATLLLAIKPHLAYLVWAAILFESIARRRIAMIAGGIAAGLAATLTALAVDPHLLHQYADAMANRPPSQWLSPTIGSLLRMAFGEDLFRLQFVPVVLGVAWFARHWRTAGSKWNWSEQVPLLLLVSFITAPYGAWPFDLVLLLPAVIGMVIAVVARADFRKPSRHLREGEAPAEPELRLGRSLVLPKITRHGSEVCSKPETAARARIVLPALIALNVACLAMNVLQVVSFWFIWVAPALLALYVLAIAPRAVPAAELVPTQSPTAA